MTLILSKEDQSKEAELVQELASLNSNVYSLMAEIDEYKGKIARIQRDIDKFELSIESDIKKINIKRQVLLEFYTDQLKVHAINIVKYSLQERLDREVY
jgi:predicted  nucleic acid-binding Zn-ribbon protein